MQAILLLSNAAAHKAVMTASGSKTYLKMLVPSTLSFIIHQRTDLDRDNFEAQTRKGITFWVFKKCASNKAVQGISKSINGALDALEKNYLRELYLIFNEKSNPDNIIESYKFSFKYLGSDVIAIETPPTSDELENNVSTLFESIKGLDLAKPLTCCNTSMRIMLTYYNDIMPIDYHPPSYTCNDSITVSLQNNLTNHSKLYIQLGLIKTGHHTVKIRGKGDTFSYVDESIQGDEVARNDNYESVLISDNSITTNFSLEEALSDGLDFGNSEEKDKKSRKRIKLF